MEKAIQVPMWALLMASRRVQTHSSVRRNIHP
jgi:ribosomal protein L39E